MKTSVTIASTIFAISLVAGVSTTAKSDELVVFVTPYLTESPKSEKSKKVELRSFGTFSVKEKATRNRALIRRPSLQLRLRTPRRY